MKRVSIFKNKNQLDKKNITTTIILFGFVIIFFLVTSWNFADTWYTKTGNSYAQLRSFITPVIASVTVTKNIAPVTVTKNIAPVTVTKNIATVKKNIATENTFAEYATGNDVIAVKNISFTGNTKYSNAALRLVLADALGKTYNLTELRELANRITNHYRSNGFAFTRALLPVQAMTDGELVIEIIEGRYGDIVVAAKNAHDAIETIEGPHDDHVYAAQLFLETLITGEIIDLNSLKEVVLILDDQYGYKIKPVLTPGKKAGTGDLKVILDHDKKYSGKVSIDNYGNRYTGRNLYHLDLSINSPFLFGDQIKLNTLYSEENMWMGGINYSLPLGVSGLKAKVGYTSSYYELAKEFTSSELNGTAKVISTGLSYPILRSQQTNLSVASTYNRKVLNNINNITKSSNTNSSESLNVRLNYDHPDKLAGGGITYGDVTWTYGDFTVASANRTTDSTTAKTAGGFNKFNINVNRLQALPGKFTLFGKLSGQWAGNNLDSSEKFGLGGLQSVRAYPSGEAYGDEGVLAQLELRYASNSMTTLYAFYDAGTLNINHNTWTTGNNKRSLEGVGLGLRFNTTNLDIDVAAAWRTAGTFSDANQTDVPMVWMNSAYKF